MFITPNKRRHLFSEGFSIIAVIALSLIAIVGYYGFAYPGGLIKGVYKPLAVGRKACREFAVKALEDRRRFTVDIVELMNTISSDDVVLRRYPTLNPIRSKYSLETRTGGLRYAVFYSN